MSAFGGKADIASKLLYHDHARRIAANIAKLLELLTLREWMKSRAKQHRRYVNSGLSITS
jgi:hypothetical protein